jgi:hypothetical protein
MVGEAPMNRSQMIAALDEEIKRLENVRTLLRRSRDVTSVLKLRAVAGNVPKKRRMSAEGRRRIAEAQHRRWAKQKKQRGSRSK